MREEEETDEMPFWVCELNQQREGARMARSMKGGMSLQLLLLYNRVGGVSKVVHIMA